MKTWDDMMAQLRAVDNCSVHGNGFVVENLHYTLDKLQTMIEQHDPNIRSKSVVCMSLKNQLERIHKAHTEGKINVVGHNPMKPFQTKMV